MTKLDTDSLLSELEKTLPGFSYTVFSYRPQAPLYVQWNHMDTALQKKEATSPRTLMAPTLREAFEMILARYNRFKEAEDKKPVRPTPPEPEFWAEGSAKPKRKSPV